MLVVAIKEHRFRIETSDNASIRVTDVYAKKVLDDVVPLFQDEKYDQGIEQIVKKIGNEFYQNNESDWIEKTGDKKVSIWSKLKQFSWKIIKGIKHVFYIYLLGWICLLFRRLYRMICPTKTMKAKEHVRFMDNDAWFGETSNGNSSGSSDWSGGGGDGGGASGSW